MKHDKFRHSPTEPILLEPGMTTDELLRRMERVSFQGRQIARAVRVWQTALENDAFVMMGLAGAMTAAGMKTIVRQLIELRYIDCLVSTGANLFHDIYESLGTPHYMGSPDEDDEELFEEGLDAIDRFLGVFQSLEGEVGVLTIVDGKDQVPEGQWIKSLLFQIS